MSGELLHRPSKPHRCDPPDATGAPLFTQERPGTVWRCECGQHWEAVRHYHEGHAAKCIWRPLSRRRANRILKKANRNRSNTRA